ncbi:MAG: hypothetical protein ACPGVO_04395 [Spirulinaceae cyanobacterium]
MPFVFFTTLAIKDEAETHSTQSEIFRFSVQTGMPTYLPAINVLQVYQDGSEGRFKRLWFPEQDKAWIWECPNPVKALYAHKLRLKLWRVSLATPIIIQVEEYRP